MARRPRTMLEGDSKRIPFTQIGTPDQLIGGRQDMTDMLTEEELILREDPEAEAVVIDISEPVEMVIDDEGVGITETEGKTIVDFDPEHGGKLDKDLVGTNFDDNLAEYLSETILNTIATDITEKVEIDIQSRQPWENRYQKGVENLGVIDDNETDTPFDGASQVTYPLLIDGVIQFQARALAEMFPAGGPVKTAIMGEVTREKQEQGTRVQSYMNYQMTDEDEAYFEELDQMLMYLPIGGSAFKKTYFDQILETTVSKFVKPDDFIVPYTSTSLATAARFTHRIFYGANEIKKLQKSGFYLDIELVKPSSEKGKFNGQTFMDVDDKVDSRVPVYDDDDYRHTVYETCIDLDLEGFEDKDESGEETGIALPYTVSIDVESREVLSIYRNWKENDLLNKRRLYFTHNKYLPGLGFYGFGLWHIIGGLSRAATGALRAILDSAAFATMQGGFRSKDVNFNNKGEIRLTPGKYIDVDLTSEDLAKAFYTPPFKEPSPALFNVLQLLIGAGEKTASVTEAMIGEGGANTPVGTELARIEQGTKVYSGIHKRLHRAARKEFKLRAELNFEFLEHDEEYPYDIEGESRYIKGSDFDGRIDVLPVSDPNIASSALRIAQAQSVMQMQAQSPELYKAHEVHKRMLEAQNIPDIDSMLIDPYNIQRLDAISEIQAIIMQREVRAHPDQDHTAHIQVIVAFLEHPQFGGDPQLQELVMPKLIALLAEHKAYEFGQIMQQTGAPVAPVDLRAQPGDSILIDEMSIEDEYMITQTAAQLIPQFLEMQAAQLPQPEEPQNPEVLKAQAEIALKNEAFQAEQQRKDAEFQATQGRRDAEIQAELQRKNVTTDAEQQRKDTETGADIERLDAKAGAEIDRKEAAAVSEDDRKDLLFESELERDEMKSGAEQERKDDQHSKEENRKSRGSVKDEIRKDFSTKKDDARKAKATKPTKKKAKQK